MAFIGRLFGPRHQKSTPEQDSPELVTTATYADPSTIKRQEFPGTHDLYTVVNKTKKPHKPEDHLPTYQNPDEIKREAPPTGDMYAVIETKRGSRKKEAACAPPQTSEEELQQMYSQVDMGRIHVHQPPPSGLVYADIILPPATKPPPSKHSVTTATYADPSTIKRREFPGTHDLYTMVDKTKKPHKPEDFMHLPTYKVPAVLEIAFSELEVGDELGSGGYGTVYKGWWKTRGVDVAIKRVVGKIREEEAEILNKLSHPNVITFYGVTNQFPEYFIITEFAAGGSLHDCIHEKNYHPEEIQSLQWAKEIAEGMRYLHKKRILHRDLKSQNVLLTSHYGNIKLCDFGSAREFEHTATQSAAGTYRWIAPEVVKGEKVSLSSDVFSYGMVLFEIFKQEIPFASVQSLQVPTMIMEGVTPAIPDSLNPYLVNLMKCCWQMNPKARPSFLEILDILEKKECPQPVSELSEVPQPETTVIARPTTTLLTRYDLPQLQASLEEASIMWHPLGMKLKLDTKSLSGIATASGNDFSTALGFVLMRWLKPKDSVPVTMETLVAALSSPEIGMSHLAESLSKDKDKFGNVN